MEVIKSRYYTIKDIQKLENCGRDGAYDLAKKLPHEFRGKQIFVFVEGYENYYEQKKKKAFDKNTQVKENNLYRIKRFG